MKRVQPFKLIFFVSLTVVLAGLAYFMFKRSRWIPDNRSGPRAVELPAKDQLVFFAVGDTGTGDAMQYATAAAMEAHCQKIGGIDALLLLGDNFYKVGVDSVDDPQWQQKVEQPLGGPCLKRAPIFPILGNHDYRGNPGAQIDYQQVNPRWMMPSRYYTVNYGKLLRLVAFDSSFPDLCLLPETCSVDHLRHELATDDYAWRVVMAHHPLKSASTLGYSHSGGVFGFFMRPLVCGRADLYISGHAHHLEYRNLPGCDTSLIVSGAGGADLYAVNGNLEGVEFVEPVYGFVQLSVDATTLVSEFISQRGELLHRATRQRR